ncbi:MAG: DHA2 family efflux MFS transporter permease subunit [Chloroflexi bacterium]|nr:MAG: MFS transporter [Phototrophicales bacterium]RMF82389.1 MAG: DHA2 family efflux MFS transporter permease subunit [Chloroflexota bacterium]
MNQPHTWDHLPGYATRWTGLIFIGISLIVISLDNTILNVAIPSISRDLGATASELQWIVDAYILIFASLLLTLGAIGDRFGRKRLLKIGLVWFGIGSLAAALAPSTEALIAARAFLGIGGAMIMPSTLSIISATFPPMERPKAIAIWAAIFGLGVGIGPVVGGALLTQFEWNSVFLVNLPVVSIALYGVTKYLGESKDDNAPRVDFPGVVLSIIGLFALIFAIIEAGVKGWTDTQVLIAFGVAAVLLTLFAIWEAKNPDAMLPLHFFKNMSFTGANLALAMVIFSLFGVVFFLNQYTQSVLGYSPLEAGLISFPLALVLAITASNSARLAAWLGTKITVALGIAIAATSLLLMSLIFDVTTSIVTIILIETILAAGMGIAMSPATNSIMGSVPVRKAGIGSAMNDTNRQLGGALGVAILGTIMNNAYIDGLAGLPQALPQIPAEVLAGVSNSIQAAHIIVQNPQIPEAARNIIVSMADAAFVDGMTQAMLIGAFIMYGAVLFVLAVLPAQVRRPQEDLERESRLAAQPAPASPRLRPVTQPVRLVNGNTVDAIEIMTVMRDVKTGAYVVQLGEQAYDGLADIPRTKQDFMRVLRGVAKIVERDSGVQQAAQSENGSVQPLPSSPREAPAIGD